MKYRAVEVVTGAFVLAGLFVIIGGIFVIRGMFVGDLARYHARYRNAAGIEEGTPVKYNGMVVGRVVEMGIDREDPSRIRVDFEVRGTTPVTDRVEAKITRADILGDPYIDLHLREEREGTAASLSPAGNPLSEGSEVAAGEPFDLQKTLDAAQSAITTLSDLAQLVQGQVQDVIQAVSRVLASAERLLSPENRLRVEAALDDLSRTTGQVRELVDENRVHLDRIIATADDTTRSLESVSRQVDDALDTMLPKAQDLLDETHGAVVDVRGFIGSADSTLGSLDLQQVNDLLTSLDTTARNLERMSRNLRDRPYLLIRSPKPGKPRLPATANASETP